MMWVFIEVFIGFEPYDMDHINMVDMIWLVYLKFIYLRYIIEAFEYQKIVTKSYENRMKLPIETISYGPERYRYT